MAYMQLYLNYNHICLLLLNYLLLTAIILSLSEFPRLVLPYLCQSGRRAMPSMEVNNKVL